jgi:large subunit ribosomal protein L25
MSYNKGIMTTLLVTRREDSDKKTLKEKGLIPAVLYGRKTTSLPISVHLIDFKKVLKEAGSSTVITLKEGDEKHDVLIQEVQIHPITEQPYHVDFYVLEKGQTVSVSIPLEFIGEAPALDLGAQIVKVLHELDVEGKAKDLPSILTVDLSALTTIESTILVKDIMLPDGVTTTLDAEEVVVTVQMPEEEPEESVSLDISSIEVQKKGKVESEEK